MPSRVRALLCPAYVPTEPRFVVRPARPRAGLRLQTRGLDNWLEGVILHPDGRLEHPTLPHDTRVQTLAPHMLLWTPRSAPLRDPAALRNLAQYASSYVPDEAMLSPPRSPSPPAAAEDYFSQYVDEMRRDRMRLSCDD